jgi:hypothetical protein
MITSSHVLSVIGKAQAALSGASTHLPTGLSIFIVARIAALSDFVG